MPEGDTAHRAARRLHDALAGDVLVRGEVRVPRAATADLSGRTVERVRAVGKHLLHTLGDVTLHTHLKMEGEWHVHPAGSRWRRPAFQARAILATASQEAVGFELGIVELLETAREDDAIGHLGPDPLGPAWDPGEAIRRLERDERAAHVALLDQRNVAGFGNVYASELLFLRGVSPTTPMVDVDAAALVDLGARALRANVGRTRRTFTGANRQGERHWVYGREGQPCRRCGALVRRTDLGARPGEERRAFWCPVCQPVP
ncbi:DNA-formamidopyrimidine glycosylase family protein [Microbacterium sp. ZXX196]|uniref:DNA-formamidopyrimidine glycosylase family protein n=1 Tax=Microbacterium sp. ZXX196 TaxID=2609291 RepID=UPI00132749D5|nr:Fpg/Nei family DNA glycosylase [Microbacterium sp. ZXX196]